MNTPTPSTARPSAACPWLHEEVGRRMAERLQWMRLLPQRWLNWAPLVGGLQTHEAVSARYPQAVAWLDGPDAGKALALMLPAGRWRLFRQAPRVLLAPAGQGVDMVWSNMALHAQADPAGCLRDWHDRLNVDGFLMFSCLGPDTLRELRVVHQAQGWPEPHLPFVDMHDWGDRLVGAGFAEPVMDMERIVLTYSSVDTLLADLRELGRNRHPGRFAGCRSRRWGQGYRQVLEQALPRDGNGRLLLTFEIVYGHAFKPSPRVPAGQQSAIGLEDMRHMLRSARRG